MLSHIATLGFEVLRHDAKSRAEMQQLKFQMLRVDNAGSVWPYSFMQVHGNKPLQRLNSNSRRWVMHNDRNISHFNNVQKHLHVMKIPTHTLKNPAEPTQQGVRYIFNTEANFSRSPKHTCLECRSLSPRWRTNCRLNFSFITQDKPLWTVMLLFHPSFSSYLSVSVRRRSQLSNREAGVPGIPRGVYPCLKPRPWESVTVSPPQSFSFSLRLQSSLSVSSAGYYSSCCDEFSGPILFFLSGFSLFASYGLSRTLHFVSRGVERGSERETNRERKCVTSQARSLMGKKSEIKEKLCNKSILF